MEVCHIGMDSYLSINHVNAISYWKLDAKFTSSIPHLIDDANSGPFDGVFIVANIEEDAWEMAEFVIGYL